MKFKAKFGFILLYNVWDSLCKQFVLFIFVISIIKLKVVHRNTSPTHMIIPTGIPSYPGGSRSPRKFEPCHDTRTSDATENIFFNFSQLQSCFQITNQITTEAFCKLNNSYRIRNRKEHENLNVSCRKLPKLKNSDCPLQNIPKRRETCFTEPMKSFKNNFIHWKSKLTDLENKKLKSYKNKDIRTTLSDKYIRTSLSDSYYGTSASYFSDLTNGYASETVFYSSLMVASSKLPDFTMENGIFTGLPKPTTPTPKPILDFDVAVDEAFASFTFLRITWRAEFNIYKIRIEHTDKDSSYHTIEIKVNLTGDFTPNIYKEGELRRGFIYKLGSLYGNRRYYLQVWGMTTNLPSDLRTTLSFLTGDTDIDDRMYNLNGIFLVLGISTIIMLVVMICVGYEKLLLQKRDSCADFLCCRKNLKTQNRPPNGSISPEPLIVPRRGQVAPMDENSFTTPPKGFVRY